jgi:hypothetical protein
MQTDSTPPADNPDEDQNMHAVTDTEGSRASTLDLLGGYPQKRIVVGEKDRSLETLAADDRKNVSIDIVNK